MPQAPSSRFRPEGRLELVAREWPTSGFLGRVRRLLKPFFATAIGWRGALEARFPGGEVVLIDPANRNLTWNPDEYAAFRQAVRPGDCVLDVGANAGGYTVLLAQWAGPEGRVYAFEPDPRAFAALVTQITLNGLTGRVIPIQAAVAERAGTARLRLSPAPGLSHLAFADDDRESDVTVDAISIDDFCTRESLRPSVIKIDSEGSELAVLRGARQTIAARGAQVQLFVEMHPAAWPEAGYSAEDVVRECASAGFVPERLDGSRTGLWDVEGECLRLRPAAETP